MACLNQKVTAMKKFLLIAAVLGFSAPNLFPQRSSPGPVLQALEREMKRGFEVLQQKGDPSPYFISYSVRENNSFNIESSLGALRSSDRDRSRLLDVDVRVGDYQLDSTHQIRGPRGTNTGPNFTYPVLMPIDDDIDALRSVIWLETDQKYKAAVERFIQVKANRTIKVDEEDTSADMSRESKQTAIFPVAGVRLDVPTWEDKLKTYSALFKKYPEIYEGTVSLSANSDNDYVVNSEGTSIQHGRSRVRLSVYARTKADDGMELYRFEAFDGYSLDRLPSDEKVRQTIETMVKDLQALRSAPVIEPYTGPAILSGRASGVFFHEIFGHRIEGHRQKNGAHRRYRSEWPLRVRRRRYSGAKSECCRKGHSEKFFDVAFSYFGLREFERTWTKGSRISNGRTPGQSHCPGHQHRLRGQDARDAYRGSKETGQNIWAAL